MLIVAGLAGISVVTFQKPLEKKLPSPKDVNMTEEEKNLWITEIIDEEGNVMPEGT